MADVTDEIYRTTIEESSGLLSGHHRNAVDVLGEAEKVSFPAEIIDWGPQSRQSGAPLWAWILLCASLMAVSSAGVVFAMMKEIPPITLAAWRLQLTAVILCIGAALQFWKMNSDDRQQSKRQIPLLAASGSSLAVHFGCWVASVERTSLTHSLLFVSVTPVILALVSCLRGNPISRGELVGTAVGMLGTVILAGGSVSEAEVTLSGDAAALAASFALVPYLLIGRHLRSWMPLFVYAGPVTLVGAAELTLAAIIIEGARPWYCGGSGSFGWVASLHYLPYVVYLAVVPGLVGHTGINALLRYIDPLVITLALNCEPPAGSLLGWLVGVSQSPGMLTYIGGALVLSSTAVVSVASNKREEMERAKKAAMIEIQNVIMTPAHFQERDV